MEFYPLECGWTSDLLLSNRTWQRRQDVSPMIILVIQNSVSGESHLPSCWPWRWKHKYVKCEEAHGAEKTKEICRNWGPHPYSWKELNSAKKISENEIYPSPIKPPDESIASSALWLQSRETLKQETQQSHNRIPNQQKLWDNQCVFAEKPSN